MIHNCPSLTPAVRFKRNSGFGFTTNKSSAFTTGSVLANDTDPDDDPLSVTGIDTAGTLGQVLDNGNGTFRYDPDGRFDALQAGDVASDTFDYTIGDGQGNSDTATVTITINGGDDDPPGGTGRIEWGDVMPMSS